MNNQSQNKNQDSLIETAYNRILSLIAEKSLKGGDLISQRLLAEKLEMSKQPISFALKQLEEEGIVVSIPRVGTKVCSFYPEDVWGMLQWRIAIESRAVILACEWISREQLEGLKRLASKLDNKKARKAAAEKDFRHLEVEFHQKLAEGSACEKLVRELKKLNIFFLKTMLCSVLDAFEPGTRQAIPHLNIVKALQKGDPGEAEKIITNHIELSRDMGAFVAWYRKHRLRKKV